MSSQSIQYMVTLARIRQAQNAPHGTNALSRRTANGELVASLVTVLIFGSIFAALIVFGF